MEIHVLLGIASVALNFALIMIVFPSQQPMTRFLAAFAGSAVDLLNLTSQNPGTDFMYPDSFSYYLNLKYDSFANYVSDPSLVFTAYGGTFHVLNVIVSDLVGYPAVSTCLMLHKTLFVLVVAWCLRSVPFEDRPPLAVVLVSPQILHFTASFIKETNVLTLMLLTYLGLRCKKPLVFILGAIFLTASRVYGLLAVFGLYDFARFASGDAKDLRVIFLRQSTLLALFMSVYVSERAATQNFTVSVPAALIDSWQSMAGLFIRPLPLSLINYNAFLITKTIEAILLTGFSIILSLMAFSRSKVNLIRIWVAFFLCSLPTLVLLTAEGQYVLFYYSDPSLAVGGDDIVRKKLMVLPIIYSALWSIYKITFRSTSRQPRYSQQGGEVTRSICKSRQSSKTAV